MSWIELKLNVPENIPMGVEKRGDKTGRDWVTPWEGEEEVLLMIRQKRDKAAWRETRMSPGSK